MSNLSFVLPRLQGHIVIHKGVFGQRIRALREKKGLTQEQLIERADFHPNYIRQIERGLKNVSLENIQKVADGLRMELHQLFLFDQAPYSKPLE